MTTNQATRDDAVHTALADFTIRVEAPVRWGDMDAFGHVNNTYFFRYFEIARIAYLTAIGFTDTAGIGPILAATSGRFRRPLIYPDTVHAGVRTTELWDDRFMHEYVLVSERLGEVAAVGDGMIVSFDYARGEKVPLPDAVRERIEELRANGG